MIRLTIPLLIFTLFTPAIMLISAPELRAADHRAHASRRARRARWRHRLRLNPANQQRLLLVLGFRSHAF